MKAKTKAKTAPLKAEAQADLHRALGDPGRLAILASLKNGLTSSTAIGEATGMQPQRLSRGLARLRYAGLVRRDLRGRERDYELVPQKIGEMAAFLNSLAGL